MQRRQCSSTISYYNNWILTQRQASVIVTALQLIRFEIITKAEYKQVKPTTDLMKDLIIMLESKIKVQDLR
jgi:hypothetical protein